MQKKIIDYIILKSSLQWVLRAKVLNEMKSGWQPLGGVTYAQEGFLKHYYCQAMVKYGE